MIGASPGVEALAPMITYCCGQGGLGSGCRTAFGPTRVGAPGIVARPPSRSLWVEDLEAVPVGDDRRVARGGGARVEDHVLLRAWRIRKRVRDRLRPHASRRDGDRGALALRPVQGRVADVPPAVAVTVPLPGI